MLKLSLILILFVIMIFPKSVYAENNDNTDVVISIMDDEVFTAAVDRTIITTNGTIIGKLSLSSPEQLDKLIVLPSEDHSDNSTLSDTEIWLVIAAFSASVVGVIGILLSDRRTQEANKLLKIDLDAKIRPIIARAVSQPGEKPYTIDDDHFSFRITNNGSLPAVEIKKHYRFEIRNNNQVVKSYPESASESKYEETEASPCSVGESYFTRVFCPSEFIDAIRKTNDCYFELKLIYKDTLNQEFLYSLEGHFEKGEMIYGHIKIT